MNDLINALSNLLSNVILPNLRSVQARQAEQMEQSARVEAAITELRQHIELQFNHMNSQLNHNYEELTRLRDALIVLKLEQASLANQKLNLIH
jgi:uncharacterized membrane-anchored protein